jgi:threonine synthase
LAEGEIKYGDLLDVTVPTGNFGNILAAYIAKKMGLPLGKLVCASNCNDILTDFINTGVYDRRREFFTTVSPSMDILISSNLERLLWFTAGADKTKECMEKLAKEGIYSLDSQVMEEIRKDFAGYACSEEETKKTISEFFEKYGYLCDTHTAVAIAAYEEYKNETGDNTKTVIASTANPYKFSKSVLEAVDSSKLCDNEFEIIKNLNDITSLSVPPSLAELSEKKVRFTDDCKPAEMEDVVLKFLR